MIHLSCAKWPFSGPFCGSVYFIYLLLYYYRFVVFLFIYLFIYFVLGGGEKSIDGMKG